MLPTYRGLHSIVWAILNGEEALGWTVHKVDEGIDTGDIYYQSSFRYRGETSWQIMEIFDQEVEGVLGHVAKRSFSEDITPQPQDHNLATWVPRRNREDCLIDFDVSYSYMTRFFKALVPPYPCPMIEYKKERYQVIQSDILNKKYDCGIKRVVNVDDKGVYIKFKGGIIIIKELLGKNDKKVDPRSIFPLGARL